jgi:hypothetical protein
MTTRRVQLAPRELTRFNWWSRTIAIVIGLVFVSNCGPGATSAGDVVVSAYSAANRGQYDQADRYLSSDLRVVERQDGGSKIVWDANTRGRQLRSITIRQSTTKNDSATVIADLTFNNGCTTRLTASLHNQWRAWPPSQDWLITRLNTDSTTCRPIQGVVPPNNALGPLYLREARTLMATLRTDSARGR